MLSKNVDYFVPVVIPGMDIPIIVTEVGESYWNKGQEIRRNPSDIMALELVIVGTLFFQQGKSEYLVERNEVIVLKRGLNHYYKATSENLHKIYFGLSGEFAEILVERLDNRVSPLHADAIFNQFREILKIGSSKPPEFYQRLSEAAYGVLLELLLSQDYSKGRGVALEGVLLHALQFMQKNMDREITMAEIAHYCCVSTPHLHGLFRLRLHASPIQHFHAQKVKVAQNLLRTTRLSCKEISRRLGFNDQLHFSRLFKKSCGASPMSYRAKTGG